VSYNATSKGVYMKTLKKFEYLFMIMGFVAIGGLIILAG